MIDEKEKDVDPNDTRSDRFFVQEGDHNLAERLAEKKRGEEAKKPA